MIAYDHYKMSKIVVAFDFLEKQRYSFLCIIDKNSVTMYIYDTYEQYELQ